MIAKNISDADLEFRILINSKLGNLYKLSPHRGSLSDSHAAYSVTSIPLYAVLSLLW